MTKDTSSMFESNLYGKVPDGMSYQEIANVLKIPKATVILGERRALKKLRKAFVNLLLREKLLEDVRDYIPNL